MLNERGREERGRGERERKRTDLEVLISFDLIITTSIMQSADESVSAHVNRNGHRGAVFEFPVI